MNISNGIKGIVKRPMLFASVCGASITPFLIDSDCGFQSETSFRIDPVSGNVTTLDQGILRFGKDNRDIFIRDSSIPVWVTVEDGAYFSYAENTQDAIENQSPELVANLETLESIRALQKNWNENQAEPFSDALVNKVIALVKTLSFQPQIFPTAEESIQLEFDNEKGDYLEFELFENNTVRKFFCDSEGHSETSWISIGDINDDTLRTFFAC